MIRFIDFSDTSHNGFLDYRTYFCFLSETCIVQFLNFDSLQKTAKLYKPFIFSV